MLAFSSVLASMAMLGRQVPIRIPMSTIFRTTWISPQAKCLSLLTLVLTVFPFPRLNDLQISYSARRIEFLKDNYKHRCAVVLPALFVVSVVPCCLWQYSGKYRAHPVCGRRQISRPRSVTDIGIRVGFRAGPHASLGHSAPIGRAVPILGKCKKAKNGRPNAGKE